MANVNKLYEELGRNEVKRLIRTLEVSNIIGQLSLDTTPNAEGELDKYLVELINLRKAACDEDGDIFVDLYAEGELDKNEIELVSNYISQIKEEMA